LRGGTGPPAGRSLLFVCDKNTREGGGGGRGGGPGAGGGGGMYVCQQYTIYILKLYLLLLLSVLCIFLTVCRGEPQTRTHGLGSRFWFHVKPVFPFPPLETTTCS